MRAKGGRGPMRDAPLLADAQGSARHIPGRRWLAAKNVNERGAIQRLGEGQRVPERLGLANRRLSSLSDRSG